MSAAYAALPMQIVIAAKARIKDFALTITSSSLGAWVAGGGVWNKNASYFLSGS